VTEAAFHRGLTLAYATLAGAVFLFSLFVTAPYGRHGRTRWSGPDLPSRIGWMLMELPQPAGFVACFLLGQRRDLVSLVLLGMWCFHYSYRTLIYPFIPRASAISLSVVSMGFALNVGFSYLNGRWLFTLGPMHEVRWLLDARFLLGVLLFFGGFALCASSDLILRRLRPPGETAHRIPRGGAYRWVSSPNYLGEILQWCGWTLASWSLAGLTLALITAANLVPRARVNHRWCQEHLEGYPPERKALIPFLF
jgi:3-oxo-5-alpha-steroid 4-dehydrogenase 1